MKDEFDEMMEELAEQFDIDLDIDDASCQPAVYQVIAHAIDANGDTLTTTTLSTHLDPQSAIDDAKKTLTDISENVTSSSDDIAKIRVCVETVIKQDGEDADCGTLFDEYVEF